MCVLACEFVHFSLLPLCMHEYVCVCALVCAFEIFLVQVLSMYDMQTP